MTLFSYRVPMMASLLVWCALWEIVGRLDLILTTELSKLSHVRSWADLAG